MDFGISRVRASDCDWVLAAHAEHYARVERFDATFPAAVARAFDECRAAHGSGGWIARQGGVRCGSLLLSRSGADALALRLFFVAESARGTGLGRRLLTTARNGARERGARVLRVATFAEHSEACALYRSFGFALNSSSATRAFGRDLTLQSWSYPLAIAESER